MTRPPLDSGEMGDTHGLDAPISGMFNSQRIRDTPSGLFPFRLQVAWIPDVVILSGAAQPRAH